MSFPSCNILQQDLVCFYEESLHIVQRCAGFCLKVLDQVVSETCFHCVLDGVL